MVRSSELINRYFTKDNGRFWYKPLTFHNPQDKGGVCDCEYYDTTDPFNSGLICIYASSFIGIPITTEILQGCGFEKCKSPYKDVIAFSIYDDAKKIIFCNGELFKELSEGFIAITIRDILLFKSSIESLHQLQNIFFALTGDELQVSGIKELPVNEADLVSLLT